MIAYVGDVIGSTYIDLHAIASLLSEAKDSTSLDDMQRNQLFRLSWEIVEHADSIRNLISASDNFKNIPKFKDLVPGPP